MQPHGASFLVHFVLLCLVVAAVCTLVREGDRRRAVKEGLHFFVMMLLGISGLSAIVFVLEMLFIRA